MQNPLDQFRRSQPQPATSRNQTGLRTYKAFEARDKAEDSLEIRQLEKPWQAPEWRYIANTIYNGEFATRIVLIYNILTVEIEGEHLQHLIIAIRKKTCTFIQDFNAQEFTAPEPSQAIIHSIIVTPRKEDEDFIATMPKNIK